MPLEGIERIATERLREMEAEGRLKGAERVITGILSPAEGFGARYTLSGEGERPFLRMNSNGYLGLEGHPEVIKAEEREARRFGTGPGAVRFISGTYLPHVALEERLAAFHGREEALLFSSAYSSVMGVLPPLMTNETLVVSDALNHNCIINAIRLGQPAAKAIYPHLDMAALEAILRAHAGQMKRTIVVTDGVFSMRGDHAPLDRVAEICRRLDGLYPEGILTVADDSHGIGALGETGRGTEEETGGRVDLLVATLGKGLGVNGGYAVSSGTVIRYLRESSPLYIYSNPITPSEAAAAGKALEILDSPEGVRRLEQVRALAARLREGLAALNLETLPGRHPIVPLLVRETERTRGLAAHLYREGVLATGLFYPVVPRGDEEIRFQVNGGHTERDIDLLLALLGTWAARG